MKITLIFIVVILSTLIGCSTQKGIQQNKNLNVQQPPSQNLQKEENYIDNNEYTVDENINAYDMEDDVSISDNRGEEINLSSISQKLRTQILNNDSQNEKTVIDRYKNELPNGINKETQYSYYDLGYNYFLITVEDGATVRDNPVQNSSIVDKLEYLDKVSILESVQGEVLDDSDKWYRVMFNKGDELKEGYINSTAGIHRSFQFDKMQNSINDLIKQVKQGDLHFISNYKNQNGAPPIKGNITVDEFGYRSYHSAPAYEQEDINSNFRYIPDGLLVRILDETDEFYKVNAPTFGSDFYVPKKYIDQSATLSEVNNVIVIDRSQQNEATFEIDEKGLNLVSYNQATTGLPGNYSFETTLGIYKAIEKKDRFLYLKKGSQEIAGYAPYAIRFTGGAYIHGVPVEYKEEDGQKIDPGTIEYLHTIGTFPRSSMCVRNYTSHAKFLYNWMDTETGAVIVIE